MNTCIIDNKPLFYIKHKKTYANVCKDCWRFVFIDIRSKIKSKWLSWENILKDGLSYTEAEKYLKNKFFQIPRLLYQFDEYNQNEFKNKMLKYEYSDVLIDELINILNNRYKGHLVDFCKRIKYIHSFKNVSIEYYIARRYSISDSRDKIKHKNNTYKFVLEKKKNIPGYTEWYNNTRRPGGIAACINFANSGNRSKKEIELEKYFIDNNFNIKRFSTPVKNLNGWENKMAFIHDIFLEDYNCIIEYNGTFWHKDFITDSRFTEDQYTNEINKAKYCIDYNRNIDIKYVIVWEADFSNIYDCYKFIKKNLNNNKKFVSSRKIDYEYFKNL